MASCSAPCFSIFPYSCSNLIPTQPQVLTRLRTSSLKLYFPATYGPVSKFATMSCEQKVLGAHHQKDISCSLSSPVTLKQDFLLILRHGPVWHAGELPEILTE